MLSMTPSFSLLYFVLLSSHVMEPSVTLALYRLNFANEASISFHISPVSFMCQSTSRARGLFFLKQFAIGEIETTQE